MNKICFLSMIRGSPLQECIRDRCSAFSTFKNREGIEIGFCLVSSIGTMITAGLKERE